MKIWIIILVKRGLIEEPEIFYDERLANQRYEGLAQDVNPDYDELELFEEIIDVKSHF